MSLENHVKLLILALERRNMARLITACLICQRELAGIAKPSAEFWRFSCPACGQYLATRECCDDIPAYPIVHKPRSQAVIGHWLRRSQLSGKVPILKLETALDLVQRDWLPSHTEQANNLIRVIGDGARLGELADIEDISIQFTIGAEASIGVPFLASELERRGLCMSKGVAARLTLDGWNAYDVIKRGQATGFKAFMAMPFNKPDLDDTILPIARRAAKACGFQLERVDDQPKPGIIDVQIRVAIQEARFVIVDLTHANLGAYWESGYAEGMGKPVIYTVHADHDASVHFDTAHLTRVVWEAGNLDRAEKQIKAMIRNELPDAVHED